MKIIHIFINKAKLFLAWLREAYWYFFYFVLKKKKYSEYYSIRMDKLLKNNTIWGLKGKEFHLDYLKLHGLKKNMSFLDYGCGAINSGRFFINYLNTSKYIGVDISKEAINLGKRRVINFNLSQKKPRLIYLTTLDDISLLNQNIDIVWGQSVLTHMPPEDLLLFLQKIKIFLNSNFKIYLTFSFDKNGPVQKNFKDWYYNNFFLEKIGKENNYKVNFLKDWKHPLSDIDKLVQFS